MEKGDQKKALQMWYCLTESLKVHLERKEERECGILKECLIGDVTGKGGGA